MEKIGQEVQIARETEENKRKFAQVIGSVNMIEEFVELCERESNHRHSEESFLKKLFWHTDCCGWENIDDWEEEDWENFNEIEDPFPVFKGDWWDICPFIKMYDGEGDFSTVLKPLEKPPEFWEIGTERKPGYRRKTVAHWDVDWDSNNNPHRYDF